ncbi:MAG: hypothetical protein SGARI_002138 [Bacillariaceae sp.]
MGPADHHWSYIDTSTNGGKLLHYLAVERTVGRDKIFQVIRQEKDHHKSFQRVVSLGEAITAARTLLNDRIRVLNSVTHTPEFQQQEAHHKWKQQTEAIKYAKEMLRFAEQTCAGMNRIFCEVATILPKVPLPTSSKALSQSLVQDIIRHYGDQVGQDNGLNIAKLFALYEKDDVMGLCKIVAMEIVQFLARTYKSNPFLHVNVRFHKKWGNLEPNYPEDKIKFTSKSCVSSLRWIIMIYLNIPFKMPAGTPYFDVKEKDTEHPLAWNTKAATLSEVPKVTKEATVKKQPSETEPNDLARIVLGSERPVKKQKKSSTTGSETFVPANKKVLPTAHMRDNSNASLTRAVTEADNLLRQQQQHESLFLPTLAGEENVPNPLK